MRVTFLGAVGAMLAIAAVPTGALASTATTTFPVSALVLTVCSVTASPLTFASYDPTSATPDDATTTTVVTCTLGTSFQVGLNAGTTSGATVTTRKMANGANRLNYGLFQDASRTTNWGNTPGTDTPAATTSVVVPTTLTVYGRAPADQIVPLGAYTDTITVTVTY